MQHQSVYTAIPWCSYSNYMLSEQPRREISGNPKSEIDPDEYMLYQIRANKATISLKGRIKGYHPKKLDKKGSQVFGFRRIAMSKIGSDAHAE